MQRYSIHCRESFRVYHWASHTGGEVSQSLVAWELDVRNAQMPVTRYAHHLCHTQLLMQWSKHVQFAGSYISLQLAHCRYVDQEMQRFKSDDLFLAMAIASSSTLYIGQSLGRLVCRSFKVAWLRGLRACLLL